MVCSLDLLRRQREFEGCALTDLGFDPDLASMRLDDFSAQRQTNAGPGIFAVIEALEENKNALMISRRNADAVVPYREQPFRIAGFDCNLDSRRLRPAIFERVSDQVLKQLDRSEEHTSELQSHSFISYAVFCLKK